jgi:hypothetical protein
MKNLLQAGILIGQKIPIYEGTKAFLVNFHALGSGCEFPIRIRIWIQDSQMNADPCESESAKLHSNEQRYFVERPNFSKNICPLKRPLLLFFYTITVECSS